MSDSSSVQTALTPGSFAGSGVPQYKLSDDLARLCLPQEFKDSYRRLAWVNSICALFLLVGLVGLKPPPVVIKPLSEISEPVPVIFTPPPQEVKPQAQVEEQEPQEQTQEMVDTPQVVTVVAAADAKVNFSVPVQGQVMVSPQAHLAPPPPPKVVAAPSGPVKFVPGAQTEGSFPPPTYPSIALRNKYMGTVKVEIRVDPTGAVKAVNVEKSSGYPVLDEAALSVVKNRWRFPPGAERWLVWSCTFELK